MTSSSVSTAVHSVKGTAAVKALVVIPASAALEDSLPLLDTAMATLEVIDEDTEVLHLPLLASAGPPVQALTRAVLLHLTILTGVVLHLKTLVSAVAPTVMDMDTVVVDLLLPTSSEESTT